MRKLLVAFAAALTLAIIPVTASAHVLQTDGDIGAVLHIEPDDAPLAGSPVTYELAFEPTQTDFSLKNCGCGVTYFAHNKTVAHAPLAASSNLTSRNTFTFPEPAVYTIQIDGAPKNGARFASFSLSYQVRVGGGDSTSAQPIPPLLWLGLAMGVALILLYANTQNHNDTKPRRKNDEIN